MHLCRYNSNFLIKRSGGCLEQSELKIKIWSGSNTLQLGLPKQRSRTAFANSFRGRVFEASGRVNCVIGDELELADVRMGDLKYG